jgi:hypothetical protein
MHAYAWVAQLLQMQRKLCGIMSRGINFKRLWFAWGISGYLLGLPPND